MNLEEVLSPEDGLQQDEWSLTKPKFGEEGRLEVVGWSGKQYSNKIYILKCSKCAEDSELFGEGYFRSPKGNLVNNKQVPCGCSRNCKWTQEQYKVLCSRKAKELGYMFLGFVGEWKGNLTKIKMSCEKHGEWGTGNIHNILNGRGCPKCGNVTRSEAKTKPHDVMIASFFASGSFHPDTKFWRSERLCTQGFRRYWHMSCPICGESGESTSDSLQRGKRSCACSKHRQQQAYINWVVDDNNMAVAIKFGIARDSSQRVKSQNRVSVYDVRNYLTYTFPDVASCKKAERQCKKELDCGIILKRDMPDGYTETTWTYNLVRVKQIFEKNGGLLNECTKPV